LPISVTQQPPRGQEFQMSKSVIVRSFLLTVGLAALASPIAAQEAKPPTPFEKADFDGDGKISHEEYRNRASVVFHGLDINQDGYLTADELPEYRNEKGEIVAPDSLTIIDYMASVSHSFDMADVNKDGFLQSNEWGVAPSLNK
jgi:Ca2+-binding EF-hand superfamily protein